MEKDRFPFDSDWDDGCYGTGCTEPPKSHGVLITMLLVAVIFLGGIVTALSILNIRMFQELNRKKDKDLAISFAVEETQPPQAVQATGAAQPGQNDVTIDLHSSPESLANTPENGISLQEIYEKNIPSVASITSVASGGTSTGTGVVISESGYLVTNYHVIENAAASTVQLTDGRELTAGVVGTDPISDLAVLFVDAENLTPAQLGNSEVLRVGDAVVAIGDPLGSSFRGTMTDGIISAINRNVTVNGRTMNLIQTNAALNSGNSGGPLINCYGQVIGINTMKIGAFTDKSGVEGLGFAIPSATVKEVVNQLIRQGYVSGRPWLGIQGESFSPFYQHFYRMPAGLYITEVEAGSPAALAGIQEGDLLLTMDGESVTGPDTLNRLLYAHQVGDSVELTVYRNGSQGTATVTIGEARG